jgi:hypothetical protein
MKDKQPVPCPIDSCNFKGSKTAIRKHLHVDHGKSCFEAEHLMPFETTGRSSKATLQERIKYLENLVPLRAKPVTATMGQSTIKESDTMSNEAAFSEEITKLKGQNEQLTNQVARLQEDKKGLQSRIDEAMSENTSREARVASLSSKEHEEEIITTFLKNLDQDNFIALGVKKGFLEEAVPDAFGKDVATVAEELGLLEESTVVDGQKVRFSKNKPADPTGWEYTKALNLWVKIE